MTLAFYLETYLEAATISDHLMPVCNDLTEVSYSELATSPALLKYELLSDGLYETRRAAEKAFRQVKRVMKAHSRNKATAS